MKILRITCLNWNFFQVLNNTNMRVDDYIEKVSNDANFLEFAL